MKIQELFNQYQKYFTSSKSESSLTEAVKKKGGVNIKPTTAPPPPPKGQGGIMEETILMQYIRLCEDYKFVCEENDKLRAELKNLKK